MNGCLLEARHEIKRRWFRSSFELNLQLTLTRTTPTYPELLNFTALCIKELVLPVSGLEYAGTVSPSLRMIRGMPLTTQSLSPREELFALEGELFDPPYQPGAEERTTPFRYSLESVFERFDERQDIFYRLQVAASEKGMSDYYPLKSLANLIPARFSELRFGREIFRKRDLGLGIALTPIVENSFSINVTSNRMKLELRQDRLENHLSLAKDANLLALSRALELSGWCSDFIGYIGKLDFSKASGHNSLQY